jgi:MFS family permease
LAANSLVTSLKKLKGNARACVYSEPLWGIPYNLTAPYASVYMLALGLNDRMIGLVVSIGLGFQIFTALLGGAVTDKLGRRWTTLIFDLFSWSMASLIWAFAHNFAYFVIAVIFNSLWRIPMTAWTCLLVEDTDHEQLLDIYSWIYISGLLAAFFAPIAGLLINKFSLIPTMRGLYVFSSILMTLKFYLNFRMASETREGLARMQASKNQNLFRLFSGYDKVLKRILQTPRTLYTIGIMMVMAIYNLVFNSFWSIIVTQKIHIPIQDLAYFPFARSIIMLIFFFLVVPRIREMKFKKPMLIGFFCFILSQIILVLVPERGYLLLLLSVLLEACSFASINVQLDKMVAITVSPDDRARSMALIYVSVIILISPFGWIAGILSGIDRSLPFVMTAILFVAGAFLTIQASRAPGISHISS